MQNISSHVVELFDKTSSKSFDATDELITKGIYMRGETFRDTVISHLSTGASILDYGCGRGRISRMLAEAGYKVDGLEPSTESLKDARKQDLRGLPITFTVLKGIENELDSDVYDGIVCSSVIEFVEDTDALLSNFRRALKPGGMLFISFSNRASLWRVYAKLRFGQSGRHFAVQRHAWTPGEFKKMLLNAGFSSVRNEAFFEPPAVKKPLPLRLPSSRFLGTLGLVSAVSDI